MSPDDAKGPFQCLCGVQVVAAELLTRPRMFALVEGTEAGSAGASLGGSYQALPTWPAQLALVMVPSAFGMFQMHYCRAAVGEWWVASRAAHTS